MDVSYPEAAVVLVSIYSILILISGLVLWLNRQKIEISARFPILSVLVGILNLVLFCGLLLRESNVLQFSCTSVLWAGNFVFGSLYILSFLRLWGIAVMSDRDLRKQYRWTITFKVQFLACFSAFCYIFVITVLIYYFDLAYFHAIIECKPLLPWFDSVFFVVPLALVEAVFLWKISKTFKSVTDYYGISGEVKIQQYLTFPTFIVYLTYAEYENPKVCAEYILVLILLVNSCTTLFCPATKLFFSKKLSRKNNCSLPNLREKFNMSTQQTSLARIRGHRANWKVMNVKPTLSGILRDESSKDLFRKHAQKALCAENVDFCLEVIQYKLVLEKLLESPTFTTQTFQNIHKTVLSIINEFVLSKSPSEVNISSQQREEILRYCSFEQFAALAPVQALAIFDKAYEEVKGLLHSNIYLSFAGAQ